MKVLITGAGFSNKGAEAMLLSTYDAVRRRLPSASVYAHVNDEEGATARSAGLLPTKPEFASRGWLSPLKHLCTAAHFRSADWILDVGGYQFGDIWGVSAVRRKSRVLRFAVSRRTRVCYLPQAWGPFENPEMMVQVRDIVSRAWRCYARDSVSLVWLQKAMQGKAEEASIGTDVAWTFEGSSPERGEELIRDTLGHRTDTPLIAVAPNVGMAIRSEGNSSSRNPYIEKLSVACNYLARELNAQILFVTHHFHDDRASDERVCRGVIQTLSSNVPCGILSHRLSAADIKAVLGCCNLLLASRYHALIAALSQGVPSIAFGWSHKYEALMEEAGFPHYSITMENSADQIRIQLQHLIENQSGTASAILSRAAQLRSSANSQFDSLIRDIQK